jgi:hypothetical protein
VDQRENGNGGGETSAHYTSDRRRPAETLACTDMALEITPQPTEEERAAIEAALEADAREERPSPWAQALLPRREDDLDQPD